MASGDNVDVIEVVETTSFPGSATQPAVDHLRPDQSTAEEDCECSPELAPPLFPPPSSVSFEALVSERRDPNL